jgi:hypothetical protein
VKWAEGIKVQLAEKQIQLMLAQRRRLWTLLLKEMDIKMSHHIRFTGLKRSKSFDKCL